MKQTIGPVFTKLTGDAQRALARRLSPQPAAVKPQPNAPAKAPVPPAQKPPVLPKGIPQTMSIKVMAYLDGKLANTFNVTAAYNSDARAVYDVALRTPYISKRIAEGKTAERGVFRKNESLTIRLRTPETAKKAAPEKKAAQKAEVYYRVLVYNCGSKVNAFYVGAPRGSDKNTVLQAALRTSSMQRYQKEFNAEPSTFTPNSSLKINLVRKYSPKPAQKTQSAPAKAAPAKPTPANDTQAQPTKSTNAKAETDAWNRFLVWAPSLTSALYFLTHFNKLKPGDASLAPALVVFACLLIAANGIIWLGKSDFGVGLSSIVIGINAPYGFLFMLYFILQLFGKDLSVLNWNMSDGLETVVSIGLGAFAIYLMIKIGLLANQCAKDQRRKKQ